MKRLLALAAAASLLAGCGPAAAGPGETFVEAPGPAGPLKGTMLTPPGSPKAPLVLIIPGSGPIDRDGNGAGGIKAASYRLLAEALASNGVASVRIDKRGMFASAAAGDGNHVTMAGYGQDL